MSAGTFFATTIAPAAGVVISEMLHLGPMYAVLESRRNGRLGTLDPVLFATSTPQAAIWVLYGALLNNVYHVLGSIGGIFLGMFYIMTVMQLGPTKTQTRKMEVFLLVQIAVISIIVVLSFYEYSAALRAAGLASMLSSFSLYGTAFLNIRTMVANRDASSINRGFLSMQVISGTMWTAYSVVVFDINVLVPSLICLSFGLIQIGLCVLYRQAPARSGGRHPLYNLCKGLNECSDPLLLQECYRPAFCFRRGSERRQDEGPEASEMPNQPYQPTVHNVQPGAVGTPSPPIYVQTQDPSRELEQHPWDHQPLQLFQDPQHGGNQHIALI